MAETTKIQWTDATFNPWRGCTKVSEGCRHCYAETGSKRNPGVLGVWGSEGTRVVASAAKWREPLRWDLAAEEAGIRRRVFCASLCDVFEGAETMPADDVLKIAAARAKLWDLIRVTPHLDWQLLTKRPENVRRMTYDAWTEPVPGHVSQNEGDGWHWHWPANVWLGVSVENQETAEERIPVLLDIPARVRFLSCEPLLGPVDLLPFPPFSWIRARPEERAALREIYPAGLPAGSLNHQLAARRLHWCIVGGESGAHARPCRLAWVRALVAQCRASEVACFVKQLGARVCGDDWGSGSLPRYQGNSVSGRWLLRDPRGGDMEEWPTDLRIREFPS